jgi:hypothetical protein
MAYAMPPSIPPASPHKPTPIDRYDARLEDVVAESDLVFPVRRLERDGLKAWARVIERDYEAFVTKDESSPYEPGPKRRWLEPTLKSCARVSPSELHPNERGSLPKKR